MRSCLLGGVYIYIQMGRLNRMEWLLKMSWASDVGVYAIVLAQLDILNWAQDYGLWAALVIFFISAGAWREKVAIDRNNKRDEEAQSREEKLIARVVKLEDEQREVMLPLVRECAQIIAQNTVAMANSAKVIERLENWIK